MLFLANFIAISLILGSHAAVAHGDHWHHHGRGDHHDHNHGARDRKGYLRRLDNVGNDMNMPRHPEFVVGGKAYGSHGEFFQMGGKCQTQPRTPEEEDRANHDFKAWKEAKEKRLDEGFDAELGGRRLGVDWITQTITVPVHFHVIHAGDTGKQYTYKVDPSFIERSIKALNNGFRGVAGEFPPYPGRSYEQYTTTDADSNIRFCLAGTTTTDNADWYYADPWNATLTTMKEALHNGGSETLNVYASNLGGAALGMATKPPNDSKRDGVIILNEVMSGGPLGTLSEGDTLTHEVGHWLGLMHTHDNPNNVPCSGEGDYVKSFEASESYGCEVKKDDCPSDGGPNPIHNFMSYSSVRNSHRLIFFFHHSWFMFNCSSLVSLVTTSATRTIVWINSPPDRTPECSKLGIPTGINRVIARHIHSPQTGSAVYMFPGQPRAPQHPTQRRAPQHQRPQRRNPQRRNPQRQTQR
jgi:hypothetical protein